MAQITKYTVTLFPIQIELNLPSDEPLDQVRLKAKLLFAELILDPDREAEVPITINS